MPVTRTEVLVAAALAAVTLATFAGALACRFVNYDDPDYVTNNPHVLTGLTPANVAWAFTTTHAGYWQPLTWLSLQFDASLYGPEGAWGFHLTNVLLHAANAVLLFAALRLLTGALWRPALAAALFALHPLRVESVAWVTERKDVLSGLGWMLALAGYALYARRPGWARYLLVLVPFALGLASKPMVVTLPFVLLLLDAWPLRRPLGWRLVAEKLPLFALSVLAGVVTVYTQREGGAMVPLAHITLADRLANAPVAYYTYLRKTLWPSDLAVFYPYAPSPPWVAAVGFLAAVTAAAVWLRRPCPYLLVGWLWFLGTLVPVIGLMQAGGQALADRFSYLPSVGLCLAATWGGAAVLSRWRAGLAAGAVFAAVVLAACAALSVRQTLLWRDSLALWQHTVAVAAPSAIAENNLAGALVEHGRAAEAGAHYAAATALAPDWALARHNLAGWLATQGRYAEAFAEWEEVERQAPDYLPALAAHAGALARTGRTREAADRLRLAASLARGEDADDYARGARAVERLIENPWYQNWAHYPVGTIAVRRVSAVRPVATEITRLAEKGEDRAVLEVTSRPVGDDTPPAPTRAEVPRMIAPPPGVSAGRIGLRPPGAVEDGAETVTAGGREYHARRYTLSTPRGPLTVWIAEEVPGGVVRSESVGPGGRTVELLEVRVPE
jgi:hypothetical protein